MKRDHGNRVANSAHHIHIDRRPLCSAVDRFVISDLPMLNSLFLCVDNTSFHDSFAKPVYNH